MKKAISKYAIEVHRAANTVAGLPDCAVEYIILDGTRSQLENWEPWKTMKANHLDYICSYMYIDETKTDSISFDKVNYSRPLPPPATSALLDYGGEPGDTAMVFYNVKEGFPTDRIIFLKGNIENSEDYYIIEIPDVPSE